MMRKITRHEQNVANLGIKIMVMDDTGAGGANHVYQILCPPSHTFPMGGPEIELSFQNGVIQEAGVNGLTHEVLLAILIDRLEGFQQGPYKCTENQAALESLESALRWLKQRTNKQGERGVEGTMEV